MDALHTRQETARCIPGRKADDVMTAVKNNQETIREDLVDIDWSEAREGIGGPEKAHGRLEQRNGSVLDITGPEWDPCSPLHGRKQAFRIVRKRTPGSRRAR